MIFRLMVDVSDDVSYCRRTNADSAIAILPTKFLRLAANSSGGVNFELAQDISDCTGRGKVEQQVDMIGGATDCASVKICVGADANQ